MQNLPNLVLVLLFGFFKLEEVVILGDVCANWNAALIFYLTNLKSIKLLLGDSRSNLKGLIYQKFRDTYFDLEINPENGQLLVHACSAFRDIHNSDGLSDEMKEMFSPANLRGLIKLTIAARVNKQGDINSIIDYLTRWITRLRTIPLEDRQLTTLELYIKIGTQFRAPKATGWLNRLRATVNNFIGTSLANLTVMFQGMERDTTVTIRFPILAQLTSFRHYSCHCMSSLAKTLNDFVLDNNQLQIIEVLNHFRNPEEFKFAFLEHGVMERLTRISCLEPESEAVTMPRVGIPYAVLPDLYNRLISLTHLSIRAKDLSIRLNFVIRCASALRQLVSFAFEEYGFYPLMGQDEDQDELPILSSVKTLVLIITPYNHSYLIRHDIVRVFPSVEAIDMNVRTSFLCHDCHSQLWYRRTEEDRIDCLRSFVAPLRDCVHLRYFVLFIDGGIMRYINFDNVFCDWASQPTNRLSLL